MRRKVEVNYYAFGLKIAGISSQKVPDLNEGNIDNKNLYNDKELFDDADLNWYDYGFRNYDAQIGRFTQLDPLTWDYPELTNYQYASDEPIANVDLDGLEAVDKLAGFAGHAANQLPDVVVKSAINHGSSWGTRAWGALKGVGGLVEAGAGAAFGIATSWTGIGGVAGGAVFLHGADVASSGFTQLWTGQETKSFTEQGISKGLQAAGVSANKANTIASYTDAGISIVGSGYAAGAAARDATFVKKPPPVNIGFSGKQIQKFAQAATKNAKASKVMLGSFEGEGNAASYSVRAGKNYTYFSLDNWNDLFKSVGGNYDEMWKINKQFIDEQWNVGKDFFFSHDPNNPLTEGLQREIIELKKLGVREFKPVGENLWKAIR